MNFEVREIDQKLFEAVDKNDKAAVKNLLKKGADIRGQVQLPRYASSCGTSGYMAIGGAVNFGPIISFLAFKINHETNYSEYKKRIDIVDIILKLSNKPAGDTEFYQSSPLWNFYFNGKADVMRTLLDNGAGNYVNFYHVINEAIKKRDIDLFEVFAERNLKALNFNPLMLKGAAVDNPAFNKYLIKFLSKSQKEIQISEDESEETDALIERVTKRRADKMQFNEAIELLQNLRDGKTTHITDPQKIADLQDVFNRGIDAALGLTPQ